MSYYRTCPDCGANLDPGEQCDCQKEKPAFLSIRDAAAHWGVSYDLVYNLIVDGKLEAVKLGGCWRIRREALAQYEAQNTTGRVTLPAPRTRDRAPVTRL